MSDQITVVLGISIMFLPNTLPFLIRKIIRPSYLWQRAIISTSLYGLTLAVLWPILIAGGYSFESIGWKSFEVGNIAWSVLFSGIAAVVWWVVSKFLSKFRLKYTQEYTFSSRCDVLFIFLWAVVAAPICEETCFRGYLISTLEGRFEILVVVALSIILFALYHLPIGVGAFIHILFWAPFPLILFLWTNSLYPGMLMHALNNLLAYVILPFARARKKPVNLKEQASNTSAYGPVKYFGSTSNPPKSVRVLFDSAGGGI